MGGVFNRRDTVVRPLAEDLGEFGLDADTVMGDIERNIGLVEDFQAPSGAIPEVPDPFKQTEDDDAADAGGDADDEIDADGFAFQGEDEDEDDDGDYIDEDDDIDIDALTEEVIEEMGLAGMQLDEGVFKAIKKKIKSALQKAKARIARMRRRGKARKAAKAYRKTHKRMIAKRRAKRIKKFGAKMLAKLHKAGKRVMMMHDEPPAGMAKLAELREELSESGAGDIAGEVLLPEETTLNAGWLAVKLGEIFEAMGDAEAGEMLYSISDSAAKLSEELEGVSEEDMTEEAEEKLQKIVEATAKALATYEDLGSPSLFEALDANPDADSVFEDEDEEDEAALPFE
jgi:hypothetical protein